MAGTQFSAIYNRFLGKITDDMYLELTPQDTIRDLQRLLIDAIPGFEFPRKNLQDYNINIVILREEDVTDEDFILGLIWHEFDEKDSDSMSSSDLARAIWRDMDSPFEDDGFGDDSLEEQEPAVVVERSSFAAELTSEEINILACLMKQGWVQRQVTSIENTRMKYSGTDFKMTSQANHLQKLLSLLEESRRDQFHMQRLYKRRKLTDDGQYVSNWNILNHHGTHVKWPI